MEECYGMPSCGLAAHNVVALCLQCCRYLHVCVLVCVGGHVFAILPQMFFVPIIRHRPLPRYRSKYLDCNFKNDVPCICHSWLFPRLAAQRML